jgi:hypothetical protein
MSKNDKKSKTKRSKATATTTDACGWYPLANNKKDNQSSKDHLDALSFTKKLMKQLCLKEGVELK